MEKLIIAKFFIKAGNVDAFKVAATEVIDNTRKEEGNIFYYLYQSVENPSEFIFYEKFKDQQSLDFHINTDHYKKFEDTFSKILSKDIELNIMG